MKKLDFNNLSSKQRKLICIITSIVIALVIAAIVVTIVFTLPSGDNDPTVESITVQVIDGGEEIVLTEQNASVETILSKISVNAELSDKTTKPVNDSIIVEGFDATKLDVVQTVTIRYGDFTKTISVRVKGSAAQVTVKDISVTINGGGNKVTMPKATATEQALRGLITVKTVKSDNSTQTVTDYKIEGLTLTKVNEEQTVTIKYGTFSKTVTVEITEQPIVDDAEIVSISVGGVVGKVTLQQANATEAAILDEITVTATYDDGSTKELKTGLTVEGFDAAILDTDQQVKVKYGEFYSEVFTVVVESTPAVVTVTGISVIINDGGIKVTMQKEDASLAALRNLITVKAVKSDSSEEEISGYEVIGLDLEKVNEPYAVTIKYDNTFTKTVTVYIEEEIDQPIPDKGAYVVVNNGKPVELEVNPHNEDEFMLEGKTLKAGDKVKIVLDGETVDYKTGCKFTGEVFLSGDYSFYVSAEGVWVIDWVLVFVERGSEEFTVAAYFDEDDPFDTDTFDRQFKAETPLRAGDVVKVKDIGGNVFKYENSDFFNGTVGTANTYTFYIKLGKDSKDDIVYVAAPLVPPEPTVTGLSTNYDNETLVLYGVQANDIKAKLTVTATMSDGSTKKLTSSDYTVTGYVKTLLNEEQLVTISYEKDVEITVKVMKAYATAITATINSGNVIELIGAKATAENILKAITVNATYNDGTTASGVQEQCAVTASSFNATQYGETPQQVEICLGKGKTTVSVKVTAAAPDSLSVEGNFPVEVTGATEAAVIAAIKEAISVSIIMTDETSAPAGTYDIELETGFNFSDFDNEQNAAVKCGDLTFDIKVLMVNDPVSFTVDKTEVTISETVADRAAELRKLIVVNLTTTDNVTKPTGGYTVTLGTFNASAYTQVATISYKNLQQTETVTINVTPVPKISIKGAEATFIPVDPDNANQYPITVVLEKGETVAFTFRGTAVAFPANFNGTAVIAGTHSFLVTVSGNTATLECTVPEYAPVLTVGENEQGEPTKTGNVYTWNVTLAVNEVISITDNNGTVKIDGKNTYKATLSGVHTVTLTFANGTATVSVTIPEYAVNLTVKRAGAVVSTVALTENTDTDMSDGRLAEYVIEDLALQKNDVIVITDNKGVTLSDYEEWSECKGIAPRSGNYTIYVKFYENGSAIYVATPDKVVAVYVGNDKHDLEFVEAKNEYVLAGLSLHKDDKVVIKIDGDNYTNYKSGCKFNGTVYLEGSYDFYVKLEAEDENDIGIWVSNFVQVFVTSNGTTRVVVPEFDDAKDLDKSTYSAQYKAVVNLLAGDTVVIKDIGNNAFKFQNKTDFNGTAARNGTYTFYVKFGWASADDIVYTGIAEPVMTGITAVIKADAEKDTDGTLILYGKQAENLKNYITVKTVWNVGADTEISNYTNNFDNTKLNERQKVTITYNEKSVEIYVKVLAKQLVSIAATTNAEVIELIGANATIANIKNAITSVKATYNDGSAPVDVTSEYSVNASTFSATDYGTTQNVEISFGGETTTVKVKAIEATPETMTVSPTSVTVAGANETEVIDAIKAAITVTVTKNDGTPVSDPEYAVTLATGFEFTNFTGTQNATITYGTLESVTVTVQMIQQPKNIFLKENAISILESEASIATVKANLTVTLIKSDDTTEIINNYSVTGFSASTYEEQTVTISYGNLESKSVKVTIVPVPKITVTRDGEAFKNEFMVISDTDKAGYLDGTVTNVSGDFELKRGDTVAITWMGEGKYNSTLEFNGTYTFTLARATGTVTATAPTYTPVLRVGEEAKTVTTVASNVYTWTLTLSKGNVITVSDNMFGNLKKDGANSYTAPLNGVYTVTVTKGDQTFVVSAPSYEPVLKVGSTKKEATSVEDGVYTWTLTLSKDSVVTVSDNKFGNLQIGGAASYKAPYNGEYTFTLTTPGSTATAVTVTAPAKVTISVNGGKAIGLERNTENKDNEEYMCKGLTLQKGDTVVITKEGAAYAAYKSGCGFTGTAPRTGNYDFYVQLTGGANDIGIWVTVPEKAVTITVGSDAPIKLDYDSTSNQYIIKRLTLQKNATVVIKDDGEVYAKYKNGCAFTNTVTATGDYDFYIRLTGDDDGIWIQVSPAEKPIKIYYHNSGWDGDWSEPYLYCWNPSTNDENAAFPGEKMTALGNGWFVLDIDEGYTMILFKGREGNKTPDRTLTVVDGVAYYNYDGVTNLRPTV